MNDLSLYEVPDLIMEGLILYGGFDSKPSIYKKHVFTLFYYIFIYFLSFLIKYGGYGGYGGFEPIRWNFFFFNFSPEEEIHISPEEEIHISPEEEIHIESKEINSVPTPNPPYPPYPPYFIKNDKKQH